MQRRHLLQLAAGSAVLLLVAGGGAAILQPGIESGRLTASSRPVFGAVARAVLQGQLPSQPDARQRALESHLQRLDEAIGAFPPAVQAQLSQLLAILSLAPGRMALTGLRTDWPRATEPQLHAALDDMRRSCVTLRQQAYHALRDLTNAAYYADASVWPSIGYPGPRAL